MTNEGQSQTRCLAWKSPRTVRSFMLGDHTVQGKFDGCDKTVVTCDNAKNASARCAVNVSSSSTVHTALLLTENVSSQRTTLLRNWQSFSYNKFTGLHGDPKFNIWSIFCATLILAHPLFKTLILVLRSPILLYFLIISGKLPAQRSSFIISRAGLLPTAALLEQ